MTELNKSEKLQKEHYDSLAVDYAKHYGDKWSQKYRKKFFNDPMFEGIDLSGKSVIDALCGSGETTFYLLKKGAIVTGVDISENEIKQFRKLYPESTGISASILSTGLESNTYDCAVIVGGLHHLHPNIYSAVNEIHRILKPGGYFCFTEPHKGSFSDKFRKFWYKHDKLFAENEAAVDIEGLKKEFSFKFQFLKESYKGNIAYLLVLNSLIFRIPLGIKRIYSGFLIFLESIIEKIQGRFFSCFVVCQWRKLK